MLFPLHDKLGLEEHLVTSNTEDIQLSASSISNSYFKYSQASIKSPKTEVSKPQFLEKRIHERMKDYVYF